MPMMLRCPVCQTQFSVADSAAGATTRCQCGATIRVPGAEPVTAEIIGQPMPSALGTSPYSDSPFTAANPYAAPQTGHAVAPGGMPMRQQGEIGIWHTGKTLVMHQAATLPDVCVKSNQPASGKTLRRKLSWHPSWVALTILISPLVYIILAAILTKRATIHIGLTDPFRKRRMIMLALAWLFGLGSLAMFVVSVAMIDQFDAAPLLAILGVAGIFFALIFGNFGARLVRATKITDTHIHLKGCHPDYLKRFPIWPYAA